jgi:hypothetical protein
VRVKTSRHRVRTIVGEAFVGLAIVALIWVTVMYVPQPYSQRIDNFLKSRACLAGFIAFLGMVFTLRCYWPLRRSLKFWAFLLVYLGVLATSVVLWPFTGTPNFLWVGAVGGIEFGIFALVTQRVFHVAPRQEG